MSVKRLSNGRYQADFHVEHARVRKVFLTKTEAKDWLAAKRVQHRRGEDIKRARVKVTDCYNAWLAHLKNKRAATYLERLEHAWKPVNTWLKSHGIATAAKLTVNAMRRYEAYRETEGKARQTIVNELRLLTGCMGWAASGGLIKENPIRDFRPEKGGKRDLPEVPSPADLQQIFDQMPSDASKRAFYGLLALGCREGSFVELRAEDVLPSGRIEFKRCVKRGRTYRRPLPAFPFTLPTQGLLFPDSKGNTWKKQTLLDQLARACERAKVPKINVHTLRHAFATYMLANGEPSMSVMMMGGWASLQMVEKYMDQSKDYVALLDSARENGYLPIWPSTPAEPAEDEGGQPTKDGQE